MKILYITPSGFDTFAGSNHLNMALVIDLLKIGHEIVFVQSNMHGPYNSIPDELKDKDKLEIISVDISEVNKRNKIKRVLSQNKFQRKVIDKIKNIKNIDVAYVQSSGISISLIKNLHKRNIPIIFNIQDLFPESIITTGMVKKGLIYNFFKKIQLKTFKYIDFFTVISADIKTVLEKNYYIPTDKIEVVYNWYSETDIRETLDKENKFVNKYNLNKGFKHVIQYAGNLGYVIDYNFLVQYAKKMENYKDYVIQIVGNGSNEKHLKDKVANLNLTNIEFFDLQPNSIVSDVYSYSDLQIIPLKKGVIFHSVPSKVPIVMKCNRPVILISDSESKYLKMLKENNVAICLSHDQIDEAVDRTITLFSNKENYKDLVNKASSFTKNNFSQKSQVSKIINLLCKMEKRKDIEHV